MIGIILVNKPIGITSSNVVVKLRHMSKTKRVGHLGTLDPLASGVLPVCIGKATRLFDLFLKKNKTYVAHFEFGKLTDTLDNEGVILKTDGRIPTIKEIEEVLPKFLGEQEQVPPIYSSKVVSGVRAYKLAREGKDVELKPSLVTIFDIKLLEKVNNNTFSFEISCSSGTYIRSIARDLGESLGTCATMTKLTRTRTGTFYLNDCGDLDKLNEDNIKEHLVSLQNVLKDYEKIDLTLKQANDLFCGKTINQDMQDGTYILYENNQVIGIGKIADKNLKLSTSLKEE